MTPPHTRREAVVDTLHGVAVPDPYRWLEFGDDPEVQHWVAEQNRHTRTALDAIPERGAWHERLVALMSLPLVQAVQVRGDRLIMLEREAGAQQSRLVARSLTEPTAAPMVLADPAAGAADAASAVDWFYASPDGDLVAFGVSEGGTENSLLRIVRTADGSLLADEIPNCRACSVGWEPDATGLYYTRYPEGDEYHRTVHRHVLGEDWHDAPIVWRDEEHPQTWPNVQVSPEGRFVLVDAMLGWGQTDLHVLDRHDGQWRALIAGVEVQNEYFAFQDEFTLVGVTSLGAPRRRVVSIDLRGTDVGPDAWTTVVPESDDVLGPVEPVPGGIYLVSTRVGVDRIRFVADDGTARSIDGLAMRSVPGIAVDRERGTAVAIVNGFDEPPSAWLLDRAGSAERVYPTLDRSVLPDLSVTQIEYPSLDGTMIPMFLIQREGEQLSDQTPAILNGYGGFAIAETPMWSPTISAWCAAGGLYAVAGLRGGIEHGEDWHFAGRRDRKQNVFDDFHSAADWLVKSGLTSRERLAIAGGSNGGLLVGAALTQRPDLCRAVWCGVPLLDMVRFPEFLIARLWTDEYGDPDVAADFEWLYAYSPYHHVREGEQYPAVLLTTAEGDTRVDPMHARKMAAVLQWAVAGDEQNRPVLLYQEQRAGHGVGKPASSPSSAGNSIRARPAGPVCCSRSSGLIPVTAANGGSLVCCSRSSGSGRSDCGNVLCGVRCRRGSRCLRRRGALRGGPCPVRSRRRAGTTCSSHRDA
jgi:prolyl oligopeptidase